MTTSLPDGWELVTLSEIAVEDYGLVDGPFGSSLPASEYVASGIPVIRGSNLTLGDGFFDSEEFVFVSEETAQRLSRSLCLPEDIIFTKKGTLGQTGFVPDDSRFEKYLLSSNQMKLTVNRRIAEPLFVYYYVSSPQSREKFIKDSEATGVPKTNLEYLRTFPILLPPLPEQRTIAHILGTLDDKIELNRRMNATLEAIARAIFKSWFVDFDPVHAKARGEQPYGMDAETAALFPDAFEDSELGPIPTGWGVKKLSEFMTLDKGVSYKGKFLGDSGTPMINLGCFAGDGLFKWENLKFYSGEYKHRHIVHPGDIVLANTDMTQKRKVLGSPYIVQAYRDFEELIFTHHVYALRFSTASQVWHVFIYYLLLQPEFRERVTGFATGTTVLALPRDAIFNLEFVTPPSSLIDRFNGVIEPLHQLQFQHESQRATIATLRDALLPKLISGELTIGEAVTETEY